MTNSMNVECYVVRIYRRGRNGLLVGVVETAATGWQKPFRNVSELTDILTLPRHRSGLFKNGEANSQPEASE
jgi:hypothetical protein